MSTSISKTKRPWSRGEKFLLWSVVFVLLLVTAHFVWSSIRDRNPVATIPTPTMPTPNAFDYYVAAAKALKDNIKISNALSDFSRVPGAVPAEHVYTLAEKEALVRENAPALSILHKGFAFPYLNPPVRSYTTPLPYFAQDRGLARLLSVESSVQASHGDWVGSVDSNLDAIKIGVEVPKGGPLIAALVGTACESIGRRPIWLHASHLTATQARKATQRLEQIASSRFTFAQTLQETKWVGQAGMLELFHQQDWIKALVHLSNSSDDPAPGSDSPTVLWEIHRRLYFTPKQEIFDNYTRYMNQCIQQAGQRGPQTQTEIPIPSDPVNQIFLPVFTQAGIKIRNTECQDSLLLVTLALHAYQSEHHASPASISALVPDYLHAVPQDPFASSGTLKYHVTHGGYVLYSVGPDGIDDGGKPIFDASKPAPNRPEPGTYDQRYGVNITSKGDIVAGVNKW